MKITNKAQHTAGEWKIEKRFDGETHCFDVVGDRYVCEVHDYSNARSQYPQENDKLQEEAEANARLIASAPELFAACIKAQQYLNYISDNSEAYGEVTSSEINKILDSINLAIAKAKGE